MKIILSILFVLVFAFAAFGQSSCPVTLSTTSAYFTFANISSVPVDVTAASDCTWAATRSVSWVSLNSSSSQNSGAETFSGTGSGRFYILAIYNDGDPRTGTVSVNDKTIAVSQNSPCFYHFLNPNETQLFPADGGTHSYTNVLGRFSGTCTITYTTDDAWIHLGAPSFSVDKNEGAARTGRIIYHYGSENTLTLYVSQAAGTPAPTPTPTPTPACAFQLGTTSQTFTYSGGSGLIDVITQSGCAYTATNNDSFVTLQKASGTGNGTISYDVAANSGAARTTTITIQGQIFTVNQSGVSKTRKRVRFF